MSFLELNSYIKTSANKNILPTNEVNFYTFNSSTDIPSVFTADSQWSIGLNNSNDGSNTLYGKSSSKSDVLLDVSAIDRISFKYKTNISTEYKVFNTYLDNIHTTVSTNGTDGCWLKADIPIYENSDSIFNFRLTDSYYSNHSTEVWIDDVKLYTK